MHIAIVGGGNVGQALGSAWKAAGHKITFAARDLKSSNAVKLKAAGYDLVPLAGAEKAEVILLAIPWQGVEQAIKSLGPLAGKIVIDASNPLTADLELAIGHDDSAGETVARLAQGARVVKAFNTTGAENMDKAGDFPSKPAMFVASDDAEAKKTVEKLAKEIGFEPVDAGPLKASRYLEPMAMQWIKLAFSGMGVQFAYSLVRR
jgi:predicted dinucleotide-binding enzyme